MFLLGFVLDFIEITFVVVPIVGPVLLSMGLDPVWLGVMIAVNLQTSFLTPPFGFALFYLRGVAPATVRTTDIYRGVMPFVAIQLLALALLGLWPELATWLPDRIYG
jgi:TRAP-type mannitol/chloroaromatic compound transport system permease large subunit